MRKTPLSAVLLLACVAAWSPIRADSPEQSAPQLVLSLSSYDELLDDVILLGQLSGNPNVADSVESMLKLFTNNRGLAGLDKTRPCGAVLQGDDAGLRWYAFLPVTDLGKLIDVARPFLGNVRRDPGGVYEITGRRRPVYLKQNDGWAIICDRRDTLTRAPANPGKLLAGLSRRYDLAIRANIGNVPAQRREEFIARLTAEIEKGLAQRFGEDAFRKAVTEKGLQALATAGDQLEHVTLGWSLDRTTRSMRVELSVVASKGTSMAKTLAGLRRIESDYAGFRLSEAVFSGSWAADFGAIDHSTQLIALFAAIQVRVFQAIDDGLPDQQRARVAKELLTELLAVIRENVASGRVDGGVSLVLEPSAATLVAGRFVANGDRLEGALTKLVEAVRREHPEFVARAVKPNADQYKEVHFHTVTIDVPEDLENRDRVVRLVGEQLQVVVGIGPKSVYLAAGRDALAKLKTAIEQSEAASQAVPPVDFSVSLSKLARFAEAVGPEREQAWARQVLAAIEEASDKDQVRLSLLPIPRGVRLRLEAEEGVLKLLAVAQE